MAYPAPPVTAAEVLQFVADVLKRPYAAVNVVAADESGRYLRQATLYAPQAYREVIDVLAARGYTAAQVDTSDQGTNWVRDLAAWFVLRDEANVTDGVKLQWQAEYDCRERLKTAVLTEGGVPVAPANPLLKASYKAFSDKYDRWTRDSRL